MSAHRVLPPATPRSGSIDSADATRPAADSGSLLEELGLELTGVLRARSGVPPEVFAMALHLWCTAVERHLRTMGMLETQITALFAAQRAAIGSIDNSAGRELQAQIAKFTMLETQDQAAATAFAERLAAIVQFALAVQHATNRPPARSQ